MSSTSKKRLWSLFDGLLFGMILATIFLTCFLKQGYKFPLVFTFLVMAIGTSIIVLYVRHFRYTRNLYAFLVTQLLVSLGVCLSYGVQVASDETTRNLFTNEFLKQHLYLGLVLFGVLLLLIKKEDVDE